MPLMNNGGATLKANSRSYTNLIKSPGDSPSGQWVIDPNLAGLFPYPYAVGRRLSKVVIPKGTIVATGAAVKDYTSLKYRNIITVADGTVNKLPIGVAPYSYFRRFNADNSIAHDQFGGDDFQPGIETRTFIEVPYFPNPNDVYGDGLTTGEITGTPTMAALKFFYGCATNIDSDHISTTDELKAGDWVKAGPCGKFIKFETGDDPRLAVGQVLELDTDMPPLGWLQYIEPVYEGQYPGGSERDPVIAPEPAPADGSQVYDPNYTWPFTDEYRGYNKPGAWKTIGGGQPGLTDGAEIAKTTRITHKTISDTNTTQTVDLDPIAKVDPDEITVTCNGTSIPLVQATPSAPYYTYSSTTQRITLTLEGSHNGHIVEVAYKVDPKSMIGVPASWDNNGSTGMCRILLKF